MRRIAIVLGALAVIAVAGLLLSRTTDRAPATGTPLTAAIADMPTSAAPDVDVEQPRMVALAAVASTGEVLTAGMFTRRDVIARFTTPEFGPVLASDTTAQVNAFLVALGVDGIDTSAIRVVETPVTATATPADGGRVSVSVWSVLVVSVPETSVARQVWRTVTLDMVAVDGRWLVDGWASTDGPSPALPPEGLIGARSDVDARLEWPAAVEAVA